MFLISPIIAIRFEENYLSNNNIDISLNIYSKRDEVEQNIQFMPKVFILGFINALLAYRDIDEGRRPETYPYIVEGH